MGGLRRGAEMPRAAKRARGGGEPSSRPLGRSISQDLMAQMRAAERGDANHQGPALLRGRQGQPGRPTPGDEDGDMRYDAARNVMVPDDVFVKSLQEDGTLPMMPAMKRHSQYRGVTKHRRSGRWEAHIWWKMTGKQVYLGGYEEEDHAAEAYDLAAIKIKGDKANTNFPPNKYDSYLSLLQELPFERLVKVLRKQSQAGVVKQTSSFRGVVWYSGAWVARTPAAEGQQPVPIGMFPSEEQAARAHDRYVVLTQGPNGTLNYKLSDYNPELMKFHERQVLHLDAKTGGTAKRNPSSAPPVLKK